MFTKWHYTVSLFCSVDVYFIIHNNENIFFSNGKLKDVIVQVGALNLHDTQTMVISIKINVCSIELNSFNFSRLMLVL